MMGLGAALVPPVEPSVTSPPVLITPLKLVLPGPLVVMAVLKPEAGGLRPPGRPKPHRPAGADHAVEARVAGAAGGDGGVEAGGGDFADGIVDDRGAGSLGDREGRAGDRRAGNSRWRGG